MFLEAVIKDEDVAESRKRQVEQPSPERRDDVQGEELPQGAVFRPGIRVDERRQQVTVTHI